MKKKAVFLDRDGVINNNDTYYVYKPAEFRFNPGIFDALKAFCDAGYLLIVITNQSGISLKKYSHEDVEAVHSRMCSLLSDKGITITEIYYCTHHPDNEICLCRKPSPLLFEKAIARFGIDPSQSFMIGDSDRDIVAGEAAGVQGIKIQANEDIVQHIARITG